MYYTTKNPTFSKEQTMTKSQTLDMLYDYAVNKISFPNLAKNYGESVAKLKEIAKQSGLNQRSGIFRLTNDCGAYKKLTEPKFPATEIKNHLDEYINDTDRPEMTFREYLSYKGILAHNGTRGVPKPMPKKVWHTAQSTVIQNAKIKEKKEPLDKSTAVGLVILVIIAILAVAVLVFIFSRGFGDTASINTLIVPRIFLLTCLGCNANATIL